MNTGAREWDAETYDRVSDPQFEWGMEVLERLELDGDETVLDAGCGSGRVTAELLERLPEGRVIARRRLRGDDREGPREPRRPASSTLVMDLAELELDEPVDVVFSTATFHWIPDHDNLFRRIHASLRPGGRLVAQCGGEGNVAELAAAIVEVASRRAVRRALRGDAGALELRRPEETERAAAAAGFDGRPLLARAEAVTPERPARVHRARSPWARTWRLPEELREPFIDAVIGRAGRAARRSTTSGSTSRRGGRHERAERRPAARRRHRPRDRRRRDASCSTQLGGFEITEHLIGGASIDEHGTALTDEVLEACREADAVLLCAVGGPKWDTTDPDAPRPEQGLLGLRKGLGLYANLRPVRPSAGAARRQPAASASGSRAPTCWSSAS